MPMPPSAGGGNSSGGGGCCCCCWADAELALTVGADERAVIQWTDIEHYDMETPTNEFVRRENNSPPID
jgi:hypothetical protein